MKTKSYFAQYESPNIVIVPTMAVNAPPAKQQKLENNIVVPIVDNVTYHANQPIHEQSQTQNKTASKKIDTILSESPGSNKKTSWASSYLKSIGLAPNASIWQHKIPRKNAAKKSNISIHNTETSTTNLNNTLNIDKNNILEKHIETTSDSNKLKYKSRQESQLFLKSSHTNLKASKIEHNSNKNNDCLRDDRVLQLPSKKNYCNSKNNDTAIILHKKKKENMITVCNKTYADKIRKNQVRKIMNTNSNTANNIPKALEIQKEIPSKKVMNTKITNKLRKEINDNENKPKRKSVINPNRKQLKESYMDKTKEKNTKANNLQSQPSTSYISNNVNVKKTLKKHINTIGGVTSVKSILKVTKKYDINDLNRLKQSKKYITLKKEETRKSSKTKHSNGNFHSTSTKHKKISKSPIKKQGKKSKNHKNIKVIINIICNEQNSRAIDSCGSADNSKASPASSVELDFLNDFNVDEIIESLDTCDLQPNKRQNEIDKNTTAIDKNINSLNINSQADATDLIKILKGEEDDDLIGHYVGKQSDLFFGQKLEVIGQNNMMKNLLTSDNTDISQNNSEVAIHVKKEKETLMDTSQMIPCSGIQKINDDSLKLSSAKDIQSTIPTQLCEKEPIGGINQASKVHHDSDVSVGNILKNDDMNDNKPPNVPNHTGEKASNQKNIKEDSNSMNAKLNFNQNSVKTVNDSKKTEQSVNQENENNNKSNQENTNKSNIFSDIEEKQKSKYLDSNNTKYINSNRDISIAINLHNIKNQESDSNVKHTMSNQTQDGAEYMKSKNNISTLTEITKPEMKLKNNDINTENNNNIIDPTLTMNREKEHEKKANFNSITQESPKKQVSKHNKDEEDNIIKENNKQVKSFIGSSPQNAKLMFEQSKIKTLEAKGLENGMFTCLGAKYSITSLIHTGRYAKIFKCIHRSGRYFALKILHFKTAMDDNKKQMWYSLQADIPQDNLFTVYLVNAFMFEEKWYILMEYYPRNLAQVLNEANTSLCIEDIQVYARQLVTAVMFLRNNNMVHSDIKPKHILINSSNNILKLCGFDRLCYVSKLSPLPNVGSVNYRAPEVILGYSVGFEIDVWATAVVLYEMATNLKLFPGTYNNEILFKQICCLGYVPIDMICKSRYSRFHFIGTRFLKKTGPGVKDVNITKKIPKSTRFIDTIYNAYFNNWGHLRTKAQRDSDLNKLSDFVRLLQKMLVIHPRHRLSIEFVYGNQFIYDAYEYHQW